MLMSIVDELRQAAVYPELNDRRVLVSGLTATCGVDIARAFAERGTRLVIRAAETSSEVDAIAAILAESAGDLRLFSAVDIDDVPEAVAFAQGPGQKAFGGLECVVNLIEVYPADLAGRHSESELEDFVSEKLLAATMASRVLTNRMQLTLTEGSILHVVRAPEPQSAAEMAVLDILRATLAAIVRTEAETCAAKGIRINAVAPVMPRPTNEERLRGEPDIAALALFLASERGRRLSGHLFDATLVRRCG